MSAITLGATCPEVVEKSTEELPLGRIRARARCACGIVAEETWDALELAMLNARNERGWFFAMLRDAHPSRPPAFLRISLSGSAGTGKDYLANVLRERYGILPMSLAAPMKVATAHALGLPDAETVDAIKRGDITHGIRDSMPRTMRELHADDLKNRMRATLQRLGTELFRDVWGPDVWVDNLMARVKRVRAEGRQGYNEPRDGEPWAGVVVTDCRFRNEFDAFRKAGYLMVDVQAPPQFHRIPKGSRAWAHPSERDLDSRREAGAFDLTIMNDRQTPASALVERIMRHARGIAHRGERS